MEGLRLPCLIVDNALRMEIISVLQLKETESRPFHTNVVTWTMMIALLIMISAVAFIPKICLIINALIKAAAVAYAITKLLKISK